MIAGPFESIEIAGAIAGIASAKQKYLYINLSVPRLCQEGRVCAEGTSMFNWSETAHHTSARSEQFCATNRENCRLRNTR